MTGVRHETAPGPPAASGRQSLSYEAQADAALQRLAESRQRLATALAGSARLRKTPDVALTALASVVAKHPLAAVGAAALVGALVVRATPWQSLRHPALVAALGPALISVVQSRPGSVWLDLLMTGYDALKKPGR